MSGAPAAVPFGESSFWRFSLRFYASPEVGAACIALQDEAGADVNLLLFLLFLAEQRRRVTAEEVARLDRAVAEWRARVVKPLREVRRALKPGIGDIPVAMGHSLRAQVKRVELESERIEQLFLEQIAASIPGSLAASREAAAEANLAAYAAHLGPMPAAALRTILAAFAVFGENSVAPNSPTPPG